MSILSFFLIVAAAAVVVGFITCIVALIADSEEAETTGIAIMIAGVCIALICLFCALFTVQTENTVCPHCNAANEPKTICCCECGYTMESNDINIHITNTTNASMSDETAVKPTATPTAEPSAEPSSESRYIYCINCGTPAEGNYCGVCGEPIESVNH